MEVCMKNIIYKEKGFTLIEILIVLALIGIAGAIVIPSSGMVHRSRLISIASQIAMDINKVRFFAQTNDNSQDADGNYKYMISFDSPEIVDGETKYYRNYIIQGEGLNDTEPVDIDNIVKIKPIAAIDGLGDVMIDEIQFNQRGIIHLKTVGSTALYSYSSSNRLMGIKISFEINSYKKEVIINILTGAVLSN